MTRISTGQFRKVIEEYFEDRDMAIDCRRRRRGYALYFANDDTPLARLCPTGEDDIVEIDWWDGNHWKSVTDFGLALPLPEALDYITDDADGIFFDGYEYDEENAADVVAANPLLVDQVRRIAFQRTANLTLGLSLLGAVCGGMVAGASWGLLYAAVAAVAFCLLHSLIANMFRHVVVGLIFSGLPAMVLAGASGAVGAAVCQALGGGIWPSIGGAVVAAVCIFFLMIGTWPAWLVGFAAGLNLGISLADTVGIRQEFLGAAVIALLAAFTALLCRKVGIIFNTSLRDANDAEANGLKIRFL